VDHRTGTGNGRTIGNLLPDQRASFLARVRAEMRPGDFFSFGENEEMRTEVSAKFRRAGVEAELAAAGLAMRSWWTDAAGRFGLSLSAPA
jgi:uncharacterized SAM-dependent methyltransferase